MNARPQGCWLRRPGNGCHGDRTNAQSRRSGRELTRVPLRSLTNDWTQDIARTVPELVQARMSGSTRAGRIATPVKATLEERESTRYTRPPSHLGRPAAAAPPRNADNNTDQGMINLLVDTGRLGVLSATTHLRKERCNDAVRDR